MSNRFGMTSWDEVEISTAKTSKRNRDVYMKLQNGNNIVRILTKPFEYWQHKYKANEKDPGFGERVMSSYPLHGTDPLMDNFGMKPKRRWLVGIIDRATSSYKILDLSPTAFKKIQELSRDEDWGDPSQYDIDIKVDEDGGATGYYNVIAKPKKPLSATDLELKNQVDLEDLKRRTTPPTPEEMLKRIEAINAKSKNAVHAVNNDVEVKSAPAVSSSTEEESSEEDSSEDNFEFPPA